MDDSIRGFDGVDQTAETLDREGNQLLDEGDIDGAVSKFRAAASRGLARSWFNLGVACGRRGSFAESIAAFRRAVSLGETAAGLNLGLALIEVGDWDSALGALRDAVAVDPGAWHPYGYVNEHLGSLDEAVIAYRNALDQGDSDAGVSLAFLEWDRDERLEAFRAVARSAQEGNRVARGLEAFWLWEETHSPGLEADLREAGDDYPSARVALAELLAEQNRTEEALLVLEEGAASGNDLCWLPLGNLREARGDKRGAAAAFKRAIEAGDTHGHVNLGALLEAQGDRVGAREQYSLASAAGDELGLRRLAGLGGDAAVDL